MQNRNEKENLRHDAMMRDIEVKMNELANDADNANKLLTKLEAAIKSPTGLVDPDLEQAKAILKQLDRIIPQIKDQWTRINDLQEEAQNSSSQTPISKEKLSKRKRALQAARQGLEKITSKTKLMISKLTQSIVAAEGNINLGNIDDDIDDVNQSISDFDKMIPNLMKEYGKLKSQTMNISRLEKAKKASTYLTYTATATRATITVWLAAWVETLKEATQAVSPYFYPITASFAALIQLISFAYTLLKYRVVHKSDKTNMTNDEIQQMEVAKVELRKTLLFRTFATILNTLSLLAFLGVIATPIGAAFAAAATFFVWIDEKLQPYIRAKKALNEFDKKHNEAELTNLDLDAKEKILNERRLLVDSLQLKKSEAIWTGIPILGLALMACAPIPIAGPILSLVGVGIVGFATARNTYVAVKKVYLKRKHQKAAAGRGHFEDVDPNLENALELKERRRLTTTDTMRKLPPSRDSSKTDLGVAPTEEKMEIRSVPYPLNKSHSTSALFSTPAAANDPIIAPQPHSTPSLKRTQSAPNLNPAKKS